VPDELTRAYEFRQRAEELRRTAEQYKTAEARKLLIKAADGFDHLADQIDPPAKPRGSK